MTRIRVLIGILGLDQHEVGVMGVSRMLRDAGLEVIYAGTFNLPPAMVETAIQEDVDVIGLSCHSWEYLYYIPELIRLLSEREADIPVVVGGSVLTPGDSDKLRQMGITACFGPASSDEEIVETIRSIAQKTGQTRPATGRHPGRAWQGHGEKR